MKEKSIKAPKVLKTIQRTGAIADFIPQEKYKKLMAEEYAMVRELLQK